MSLETDIFDALSGAAAVAALVAARIYPLLLKQGCAMPAIVYSPITSRPVVSLQGPSGLEGNTVQIDAWALTLAEASAVLVAIEAAMGAATTFSIVHGPRRSWYESAPELYRAQRDFSVWQ